MTMTDIPITIIVAMAKNRVIGNNGTIPWNIPEDMAYFKEKTLSYPVIMGRSTWESLKGRPLSNRFNIILSNSLQFEQPGNNHVFVGDKDKALKLALGYTKYHHNPALQKVFIIGGEQIYKLFLDQATLIYLTHINLDVQGDTRFPELDLRQWAITRTETGSSSSAIVPSGVEFGFVVYERRPAIEELDVELPIALPFLPDKSVSLQIKEASTKGIYQPDPADVIVKEVVPEVDVSTKTTSPKVKKPRKKFDEQVVVSPKKTSKARPKS